MKRPNATPRKIDRKLSALERHEKSLVSAKSLLIKAEGAKANALIRKAYKWVTQTETVIANAKANLGSHG